MGHFNLKNNWKMLAVIASVVSIVLVLVPGAASLLILLVCPLMMIFMMGGMGMGMDHSKQTMPGMNSTPTGQIQEAANDQQSQHIRQLQGQIQELQREQAFLKEQLDQNQAANQNLMTTTASSGGTNSIRDLANEDKWPN